ncbi:hypothetical protein INT45_000127 [Circinella minor]|uniref:ATP-dependent DNA helicase n=1 Tax=Circinella minor TaxID=1195481 RepID=A0A8H7S9C9_9FUNG|nr:hypothetical protein INT45_000127 [Circinella minor]
MIQFSSITTAHSTFKIPLKVQRISMCNFTTPGSDTARLISMASINVWDEASMISRDLIETANRTAQDIMHILNFALQHVPSGGKTAVFNGDFLQIQVQPAK